MGCANCVKSLFKVIWNVGVFLAIMAVHVICFLAFVTLSSLIVVGLVLACTYFFGRVPVFVESVLILAFLSFMSKYHLIFYYKLIYPGDNYERSVGVRCVTKLIYAILASYAFVEIVQLYYIRRESGDDNHHATRSTGSTSTLSMLWAMWAGDNKYFLGSMAVLVHLFSVCLYQDYSILCKYVPLLNFRCILAIICSLVLQSIYFVLFCCEFYIVHSWIGYEVMKNNLILYAVLTQFSVMVWVIQVTLCEILSEKLCSLVAKNEAPYYWFQNMSRGRVILLMYVLLPVSVYLFYAEHDYRMLNIGVIVPRENPNRIILFMSFFCSTILHSLKTLMLLKNGLSRLLYGCWICYFNIYDLIFCCYDEDDEDDDDLSDVTSGTTTLSEITDDHKSNASKNDFDNDNNNRKKNKRPPLTSLNSREDNFGDHHRRELQMPKHVVVMRTGVGDSPGWTPQEFPSTVKEVGDGEVSDAHFCLTTKTPENVHEHHQPFHNNNNPIRGKSITSLF